LFTFLLILRQHTSLNRILRLLQVLRFWKMSSFPIELPPKGILKSPEARASVAEKEEFNFSKPLDKPRATNIDKQRSCDERSMNELSVGFSPRHVVSKADITSRLAEHLEHLNSPLSKSGFNSPRSATWDANSLTSEAWEALRRSLVYFRGQPVGTIAALDFSEENLNYDQVASPCHILDVSVFSMLSSFSLFLGDGGEK